MQNGKNEKRLSGNRNLLEWVDSVVMAVVFVALVFTFVVRAVRVDGRSMNPTLQDQQLLFISSLPDEPEYGDVVVVDAYTRHGQTLSKRVIGKAGDVIDIDFAAGIVYRIGEALSEPYTGEPTYLKFDTQFPITVPQGSVFVMGDNRNNSRDSRLGEIGCVDLHNILGKTLKQYGLGGTNE